MRYIKDIQTTITLAAFSILLIYHIAKAVIEKSTTDILDYILIVFIAIVFVVIILLVRKSNDKQDSLASTINFPGQCIIFIGSLSMTQEYYSQIAILLGLTVHKTVTTGTKVAVIGRLRSSEQLKNVLGMDILPLLDEQWILWANAKIKTLPWSVRFSNRKLLGQFPSVIVR